MGPEFNSDPTFIWKNFYAVILFINMSKDEIIYIEKAGEKGSFFSESEAKISVFDVGLQRAFGVFETLRTYNGKIFKLKEHIERLVYSAQEIELDIPWKERGLKKKIKKAFEESEFEESTMRVIITGGKERGLMEPDKSVLIITAGELHEYPEEFYEKGVKVVSFSGKRFLPQIKSINYLPSFAAINKARRKGAHEAIFCSDDLVLEGATSNLFIVEDANLITPERGILAGVTRAFVIDLALDSGIEVEKRELSLEEAYEAEEAFLTSTSREILPVTNFDNNVIGSGEPGEITRLLLKRFRKKVNNL